MPKAAKRDHTLYVRLTRAEHDALKAVAPTYMSLSDWVRQTLNGIVVHAQEGKPVRVTRARRRAA